MAHKSQVSYMMKGCVDCNGPPAASSTHGLADQLHEMLTSGGPLVYPNPVDRAIEGKKLPFLESKNVLVIMDNHLGAKKEESASALPYMESANYLSFLKNKDTIKHVYMYRAGGYHDDDTPFDLGKFSDWAANHLPKFQSLNVRHSPIRNFRLESTTLKNLVMIDPQMKDKCWLIKCPNLVELELQNHTPPVKKFQQALINCPRIETYYSHKYWNKEPLPALYLPNCTKFTFRRGDGTESLKLYLPKVKELSVEGCYNLESVQLLTKGHPDHAKWNLAEGAAQSKFSLCLTNSGLPTRGKRSLRDTGRVTNPEVFDRDTLDETGMDGCHLKFHRLTKQMQQANPNEDPTQQMMRAMNQLMTESWADFK